MKTLFAALAMALALSACATQGAPRDRHREASDHAHPARLLLVNVRSRMEAHGDCG